MRKTAPAPNNPGTGHPPRDDDQRIRPAPPRRPSRRQHHPIHIDTAHQVANVRPWQTHGARPTLAALCLPMAAGTFVHDMPPLNGLAHALSPAQPGAHGNATTQLIRWLRQASHLATRTRCG